MEKLNSWTEIVKPDPIVFSERLDESIFAADLYDVLRGEAAREYQDPERFAERTYPTEGMVQLLSDVLKRFEGKGGANPVIQIQTPFGGGKTHSLIALYHMAKNGDKLKASLLGEKVMEKSGITRFPSVKVAAFVGTVADPLKSKTPWGTIAEQLGQYDKVSENDQKRVAPGRETLEQVIGREPTLILIDEIAEFVARCPDDYQTQVLTFCQVLTETVRSLDRCCVIVTLPSSAPYGERGEKALRSLEQIFGRMQAIYEPVSGMEIYEVVRRRLFNFPDGWERDAIAVVDEYMLNYRRWSDAPDWAQSEDYREKMVRAYPFHPLLIDWLYERWGSFPTFQRTRGVLRFLGHVVHDKWKRQTEDRRKRTPLIQPAQVNLSRPEIEEELIRHIGHEFRSVIQADIRERAPRIDDGMGDWRIYKVATSLATSIFLSSFTTAEGDRKGASLSELKVAVWRPGLEPAVISDALNSLNRSLLYLHEREGLFLFSLEPNLTRLRLDYEERVTRGEIQQELEKRLRKLLEAKGDWEVRIGEKPEDIPDIRDIQMVVIPPSMRREEAEKIAKEILERKGVNPRVYRNSLVIIFADEQKIVDAERAVKTFLALSKIERSEDKKRLSPNDLKRLSKDKDEAEEDSLRRICEAYRFVVKLTQEGAELMDMGSLGYGESTRIVERVTKFLAKQDLLMEKRVNPQQVRELMGDASEKTVKEIWEQYGKLPRLPILLSKDVLAETIRQGVMQKLFAIRIGNLEYYGDDVQLPGTDWIDEAILLKEPTGEPTVSAEEILAVLEGKEEESVNSIYRRLWGQKQRFFASEIEFGEAFRRAILEGIGKQLWQVQIDGNPFVGEDVGLQTLLKGTLVLLKMEERVTVQDILAALKGKKKESVSSIYQQVWRQKGKNFVSEAKFKEAFQRAINEGIERQLWQVQNGMLVLVEKPRGEVLRVQMEVPTEQIGAIAMTFASLNQMGLMGDLIEIAFKTPKLTEEQKQQLGSILTEAVKQVGGKIQID